MQPVGSFTLLGPVLSLRSILASLMDKSDNTPLMLSSGGFLIPALVTRDGYSYTIGVNYLE